MSRSNSSSLFWGFVLIALGCLFLADNFGWLRAEEIIHFGWPLLLVIIGFLIIRRSSEKNLNRSFQELGVDPKTFSGDSNLNAWGSNVFGDVEHTFTGQKLSQGSFSTVFGDIRLDLKGTTTTEGTYPFTFNNVFGNLILEGPKEFGYALSGSTVFGHIGLFDKKSNGLFSNVNFKTPNYDTAPVKIILHASAVFGDVKIRE
jgi:lia operon protein LiaF